MLIKRSDMLWHSVVVVFPRVLQEIGNRTPVNLLRDLVWLLLNLPCPTEINIYALITGYPDTFNRWRSLEQDA